MSTAATRPLVPADFQVPDTLVRPEFRLRMLAAADAEADYEAVMASRERLRAGSPHGWPREGFTLAENLADLERHEREFHQRLAFAYTVVNPDDTRVIGCVYINPPATPGHHDAEVYMWVRDEHHPPLALSLYEAVDGWLRDAWPFRSIRYIRTGYFLPGEAGE